MAHAVLARIPLELVDMIVAKLPLKSGGQSAVVSKMFLEASRKRLKALVRESFRRACRMMLSGEFYDRASMRSATSEEIAWAVWSAKKEPRSLANLSRFLGWLGDVRLIETAWEESAQRLDLRILSEESARAGRLDALRWVDALSPDCRPRHRAVFDAAFRAQNGDVIRYAASSYPIDDCPLWVLNACPFLKMPRAQPRRRDDPDDSDDSDDSDSEDDFGFDVEDDSEDEHELDDDHFID